MRIFVFAFFGCLTFLLSVILESLTALLLSMKAAAAHAFKIGIGACMSIFVLYIAYFLIEAKKMNSTDNIGEWLLTSFVSLAIASALVSLFKKVFVSFAEFLVKHAVLVLQTCSTFCKKKYLFFLEQIRDNTCEINE